MVAAAGASSGDGVPSPRGLDSRRHQHLPRSKRGAIRHRQEEVARAEALARELEDPELDAAVIDATARIHACTGNHREQYRLDSIAVARRRARNGEPWVRWREISIAIRRTF